MYCNKCGAWSDDELVFCSKCGCRLQKHAAAGTDAGQQYNGDGGNTGDWQQSAAENMQYGMGYDATYGIGNMQPDPYGQDTQYGTGYDVPYGTGDMQSDPYGRDAQYGMDFDDPYGPADVQADPYAQDLEYGTSFEAPFLQAAQPDPYEQKTQSAPYSQGMPAEPEEPEEPHGPKGTTIAAIILAVVLIAVVAVIAAVVIRQGNGIRAEQEEAEAAASQSAQTAEISAFTADSCNATAVVLTIEGSGYQPAGWSIELTPENGPAVSKETTERSVIVDGLTPETNYTAVLKTTDGTTLTGTTECSFTTGEYTVLTVFQADSVTADQAELSWDWTGTSPNWTVSWTGSDGSSNSLETEDDCCTLTGLTLGVDYTVTLSCDSLKSAELATISVTPRLLSVSGWSIVELSSTSVSVSWDFTGTDTSPAQWTLRYVCGDAEPVTVDTDTNSGTVVSDLLPNTSYTFSVAAADGAAVESEQTVYTTSNGGTFTEYGCCDVNMTLYALDSEDGSLDSPTTVLSTAQFLGYQIEASYDVTSADKTVETLYIIRKSDGTPLYTYSSTRSWGGDWQIADHTGSFPDHITEPGSYTLEAYFNGCFMASESFTVQ